MKRVWLFSLLLLLPLNESGADDRLPSSTTVMLLASMEIVSSFLAQPNPCDPQKGIVQCGVLNCLLACFEGSSESRSSTGSEPAKEPSHEDATNYDAIAGSGRPPDRPDRQELPSYESLIKEMQDCLDRVSALLTKKVATKLIIVSDLDSTFFSPDLKRSNIHFPYNSAVNLQRHWYWSFDQFLERNKNKLLLIYNTARSYNHALDTPERTADPVTNLSRFNYGSVNIKDIYYLSKLITDNTSAPRAMMKLRIDFPKKGSSGIIGIPIPDVLIAGAGAYIQLSSELAPKIQPGNIALINDKLTRFRRH